VTIRATNPFSVINPFGNAEELTEFDIPCHARIDSPGEWKDVKFIIASGPNSSNKAPPVQLSDSRAIVNAGMTHMQRAFMGPMRLKRRQN